MKGIIVTIAMITSIGCSSNADENFDDISKIRKGMGAGQVRKIMRNQYKNQVSAFYNDSLYVENYDSPTGASDDYKIVFRKTDSIVVDIGLGD